MFEDEIKILDLLVKKDDSYFICDYKTTTALSDEHKNQVRFYEKAIKDIVKSNEVKSYVIYLQQDKIQIVNI